MKNQEEGFDVEQMYITGRDRIFHLETAPLHKKDNTTIKIPKKRTAKPHEIKTQKNKSISQLNVQSKQQKYVVKKQQLSYNSVPIVFDDIQTYRQCKMKNIVFRGVLSKRSQIYFKNLKDIDVYKPMKNQFVRELTFDSNFQCGNLLYAVKLTQKQYNLYIRVDTNTRGHKLWYFFKVRNKKKDKVKFQIKRFFKSKSLYQRVYFFYQGLRPFVFSKRKYEHKKIEWIQDGQNLKYAQDCYVDGRKHYSLCFQYEFQYQNDQIFFATLPPYSYSKLMTMIKDTNSNYLKYEIIGKSLAGLNIPLLTISDKMHSPQKKDKFILISARTHPGETSASWVIHGIINSLLSDQLASVQLRKHYTFKILPMLNPDGVFLGNYRTGLLGQDFNRNFNTKQIQLFPEIFCLKKVVEELKRKGKIEFFFDMHGHSVRKNIFVYGSQQPLNSLKYFKSRIIPKILSRRMDLFKYQSCRFKNDREKIKTARVFIHNWGVPSLTFETSFGIYFNEKQKINEGIGVVNWIQFGAQFVKVIEQYRKVGQELTNVQGSQKIKFYQKQYFPEIQVKQKKEIYQSQVIGVSKHFQQLNRLQIKKQLHLNQIQEKLNIKFHVDKFMLEEIKENQKDWDSNLSSSGNDSDNSLEDLKYQDRIQLYQKLLPQNRKPQKYVIKNHNFSNSIVPYRQEMAMRVANIISLQQEIPSIRNQRYRSYRQPRPLAHEAFKNTSLKRKKLQLPPLPRSRAYQLIL